MNRSGRRPKRPPQDQPGPELRRRRRALPLSLANVAGRVGISVSLLSMIENGQRNATPEILAGIKDALGIVDRLPSEPATPPPPIELAGQLGGLVVALGEARLGQLAKALNVSVGDVRKGLRALDGDLARSGIRVLDDGQVARLIPDRRLAAVIAEVVPVRPEPTLSPRLAEVLVIAIVHGEVTRAIVEQARGVDSAEALSTLVERGYLSARIDEHAPGKPLRYRPTAATLERSGVRTLEELQARFEALRQHAEDQLQ